MLRTANFLSRCLLLVIASTVAQAQTQANVPWNRINLNETNYPPNFQTYYTGFESVAEIVALNYYITPQQHLGTSYHNISNEQEKKKKNAHKGWMSGTNPSYNNHRAYPTFQFHKGTAPVKRSFNTPCYVYLSVYLDAPQMLGFKGQWFSLATLSMDPSDAWNRVICVNVGQEGYLHLMHVPNQGEAVRIYQNTTSNSFPMRQWVQIKIYIDFGINNKGIAAAWQDGVLMSVANVYGGKGKLEQAHFGLYASPELATATVFNDELTIVEVTAVQNYTSSGGASRVSNSNPSWFVAAMVQIAYFMAVVLCLC